ncbi:MAG: S8/S53 family peptidase [Vampirovibrionales bacterium]|nr:S8/S53 family peptidase [Vampirovibrionales bacterium]
MRVNGIGSSWAGQYQAIQPFATAVSLKNPGAFSQTTSSIPTFNMPALRGTVSATDTFCHSNGTQSTHNNVGNSTSSNPQGAGTNSNDAAALMETLNTFFTLIQQFLGNLEAMLGGENPSESLIGLGGGIGGSGISGGIGSLQGQGGTVQNAGVRPAIILDDTSEGHGQAVAQVFEEALNQNGIQGQNAQIVEQARTELQYQNLPSAVDYLISGALNNRANEINAIVQNGGGDINISNGMSQADVISQLIGVAQNNPAIAQDMQNTLGISGGPDSPQFKQALVNYVQQQVNSSSGFQSALANYQAATVNAEQNDMAIVVASGNGQETIDQLRAQGVNISNDAAFNFLAQSDNVLVAGAINGNGTVGTGDDTATSFSARGNNITFAGNGVNVFDNNLSGTSFVAPQGLALIQAIRSVNPNLHISDIKQIIQQTAINNTNIDDQVEGAGSINWGDALTLAQQSGRQ